MKAFIILKPESHYLIFKNKNYSVICVSCIYNCKATTQDKGFLVKQVKMTYNGKSLSLSNFLYIWVCFPNPSLSVSYLLSLNSYLFFFIITSLLWFFLMCFSSLPNHRGQNGPPLLTGFPTVGVWRMGTVTCCECGTGNDFCSKLESKACQGKVSIIRVGLSTQGMLPKLWCSV
jgi:hypothetical protein